MISQMDTADDARRLFRAVERYRRGSKPLYEKMTFQSLRNGLRQIAAHITKLYTAILEVRIPPLRSTTISLYKF